eukprot:11404024-Karenia_brevis.AAC.1
MLEYARIASLSVFVLFIDLVAAYDKVVRELVFGWPHYGIDDPAAYLKSIGINGWVAEAIVEHIEQHGTAFEQMGVDKKVAALVNCLHATCWSMYGDLSSCITSVTGGRQGCKLGGDIFNLAYGQAMAVARKRLQHEGIVFNAKFYHDTPFWDLGDFTPEGNLDFQVQEIVEASFVDDTALVLTSS